MAELLFEVPALDKMVELPLEVPAFHKMAELPLEVPNGAEPQALQPKLFNDNR